MPLRGLRALASAQLPTILGLLSADQGAHLQSPRNVPVSLRWPSVRQRGTAFADAQLVAEYPLFALSAVSPALPAAALPVPP
jgi:hypothetical protein